VIRAALLATSLVLVAPDAAAFCRTTTCDSHTQTCPSDEQGCPTEGAPIYVDKLPIAYRFSSRGSSHLLRDEARAAIRSAFYRWSDVICEDGERTSLRFVELEDLPDDKPLGQGSRGAESFGIYFRDNGWPYDGTETLAQTNHDFGVSSGRIRYTDIEINSGEKHFSLDDASPGIDLQAVITHEVGHYIGLAHSQDPESIMVGGYCESEDERCQKGKVAARRLGRDDIAAVCELYPPGGLPPGNKAEGGAGGCQVGSRAPGPWPIALLVGLLVAKRARRAHFKRTLV
jgi:hypothetical protein